MNGSSDPTLDRDFLRLAAGDRSVLPLVFQTLWPSVHRFCRRYLNCDADADDAAQRALEKLFAQAAHFDSSRSVLAWAFTLALWECRTLRRKSTRQKAEPIELDFESAELSPEQALERSEQRQALEAAIGQLSFDDQRTLEQFLAAEGFGASENDQRFRKRKQRAITRLKETWRRLYGT